MGDPGAGPGAQAVLLAVVGVGRRAAGGLAQLPNLLADSVGLDASLTTSIIQARMSECAGQRQSAVARPLLSVVG